VRVLFVSDVYFPRVNGVSTSIATFRTDLAECGVETTLIAPQYRQTAPSENGIIRVPSGGVPGDPEDRRMHWRALGRALSALPRGAIDLVHIHTPFLAHYAAVRFARSAAVPCIATYHTFFEEYLHHYVPVLPRRAGRVLARAFTRSQCRAVDALVAPSEPMREVLLAYGIDTAIHVVPTGLAADRFVPGDGARFRALASLPYDRPLILYVGRIAHEKNIPFLVHSFRRVRTQLPQAMFVIAGEGPALESLRQLVRQLSLDDDVRFVGYLDRERTLLDCYAAAQVFVFASRTETQGLVLLEAMAQAAPVVSTAELGASSILTPASGALVAAEDLDEFAAAVLRVLRDESLRQQMAAQSRRHAQNWSSISMARRLAALYRDIRAHSCAQASASGDSARGLKTRI
jgi:1,2-diacylglycerol 3-alpha-glucosyltransferase